MLPGVLSAARSVVIYTGFKASADALASQLSRAGVHAAAYHAGKTMQQRDMVQVSMCLKTVPCRTEGREVCSDGVLCLKLAHIWYGNGCHMAVVSGV